VRPFGWTALRLVFALFLLVSGAWTSLHAFTGPPSPDPIDKILGVVLLIGGGALLLRRTAPLGVVVLAPAVVMIVLIQLLQSGRVLFAALVLASFAALAWRHRSAFAPRQSDSE
jgi:hypothetical protein